MSGMQPNREHQCTCDLQFAVCSVMYTCMAVERQLCTIRSLYMFRLVHRKAPCRTGEATTYSESTVLQREWPLPWQSWTGSMLGQRPVYGQQLWASTSFQLWRVSRTCGCIYSRQGTSSCKHILSVLSCTRLHTRVWMKEAATLTPKYCALTCNGKSANTLLLLLQQA